MDKDVEFNDLDLIFPIINGKVSMAINRKLYRNFKKEGIDITPEQWTVLAFLWKEDGVTQQKLCDSTYKDKPSMTRLINNLAKLNLVTRKNHETDKRSNIICLTEKGHALEEKASKAVNETVKYALRGIDEKGLEQVKQILKIVFDNIKE
ncbi:MAG: MarR family winged helix-turn-helix transcriptional regulator [Dysgonomonas sp.]